MSLGVHLALSSEDEKRVLTIDDAQALVEFITEDLEERYLEDDDWSFQSDKAWDAIHRCLTDGQLLYESGPFPLAYGVLGGKALDAGDDYTACFVTAAQVQEVVPALGDVTRDWMQEQYQTLSDTEYPGPIGEDDFEYTWENFTGMREFFARAAEANRSVLFTTDA